VDCKPNELKVLLAMVGLAKNNVVDLLKKNSKLIVTVGMSEKSVETAITELRKKGILVKTGVPRVWFIDPTFFMVGYYKKIYTIAKLIEEKDRNVLEKIDEWEEEDRIRLAEESLERRWEQKRLIQADDRVQMMVVDRYTDETTGRDNGCNV